MIEGVELENKFTNDNTIINYEFPFIFNNEKPPHSSKSQSGTGSSNLHFVHLKIKIFVFFPKYLCQLLLLIKQSSIKGNHIYSISLYFGILDILIHLY